jgi:hypothetical protein
MMTGGIVALMVGVVLAFAVSAIASRHGARVAFGWSCWLPLGGLVATVLLGNRLGYGVIGLLGIVVLASAGVAGFGIALTVRAVREGSAAPAPLIWGTLVAAAPLLTLLAMVGFRAFK